MHKGSSGRSAYDPLASQSAPSNAKGLRTPARFVSVPGASAPATLSSKIADPESHASGRHLLEGSLPSGNSSSTYVPRSPIAGTHIQSLIPAIATGKGTEPGVAAP